jgi:L-fuculose-phosphate aldolase
MIMDTIETTKQLIVKTGKLMFERHLTDFAGGNISVRIDDKIYMTPTLAGTMSYWDLRVEQILTLDLKGNVLAGEGKLSREAKVHLALLNEFYPDATAVIHAHSRNVLVFCAAEKPMPPVIVSVRKFGYIQFCVDAASGTDELATNIADAIRKQTDWLKNKAAPVMAPRHGLFVMGKDLNNALDSVERIDSNAYCILNGMSLGVTPIGENTPINPNYE